MVGTTGCGEAGRQPVGTRMGVDLMPVRQAFRMEFELRRIEQLRAERKIVAEIAKESVDSDPGLQTLQTVTPAPVRLKAHCECESGRCESRRFQIRARRQMGGITWLRFP